VRLPKKSLVVTSEHNGDLIRDLGFRRVRELKLPRDGGRRAGDSIDVAGVRVTARRVVHWSPRTFHDTHRGYCGFLLESSEHRVLFGGDSAGGNHFDDLRDVDLAILGIGGYDPYRAAHATPEEAWAMAESMAAEALLPMHHSTFRLSYEAIDEPLEGLLKAAASGQRKVVIREVGGSWTGR
jgi:L-ascorbate metabolism protein UlaG (beta-lactamase superfamily)